MKNKTITAEQAKQADELGYFLVKVPEEVQYHGCMTGDCLHGSQLECDVEIGKLLSEHCPFNINNEVYCEDEQEEWCRSNPSGEPMRRSVIDALPCETGGIIWKPKETMPASLASKKWTVTGSEVVEEKGFIAEGFGGQPLMGSDEWYWKIIMTRT